MALDPVAKQLLELIESLDTLPMADMTPELMRSRMKLPADKEPVELRQIENVLISGSAGPIEARVYVPDGGDNLPLCLFYHGGGFVVGELEDYDSWCRRVAKTANTIIVSVNYALAPEYKFPQGPNDCYDAFLWAAKNGANYGGDNSRIAVMGDSAGGCMAAVVCQKALAENGPKISHQVLIYPVTDFNFDTPSYITNANGYFLTREKMQWFWHHYLADTADGETWYASPAKARRLTGLPSATVITAEYDPLKDEGKAYSDRLNAEGVLSKYKMVEGMFHGFVSFINMMPQAEESIEYISAELKQAFNAN